MSRRSLSLLRSCSAIAVVSLTAMCLAGKRAGSFTGAFSPAIYASPDLADASPLVMIPNGGFTGSITITFSRTLRNPPPLFQPLPSSVQVSAPGSPVKITSSSAVSTPVKFTWTSWPVGDYEVYAILTSGTISVQVPVEVYVKANRIYVTTWHNDGMRTGQNPLETTLTTSNVNSNTFGKLFEHLTNGGMEAQPLYVPSVYTNGAFHNVVYTATMNDYVYAFDADSASGSNANPLWTTNVGPVAPAGTGGGGDGYNQGAVGTPVVDVYLNTIYVVSKNFSNGVAYNLLHALDLGTGKEKFGGPVHITATINGTKGGVNGQVIFQPLLQYQRVGLLLLNNVVYVAFGGLDGDPPPCRGWIMGYNPTTLKQVCAYTTAPDAGVGSQTSAFAGGAIWMSGGALATDGTYIFAATGNGDFDANNVGGLDYGDSCIKLIPSSGTLKITDFFTPFNQQTLDNADLDLGSSGPMVIPSGVFSTPFVLQLSKTSEVYLLNKNDMGKFNSSSDRVFQEFSSSANAFHCNPAYYNRALYFASDGGPLTGYSLSSSGINTTPFGMSSATFDEATPEISFNSKLSNQTASAIVWIVENAGNGTLHAYKASDLTELFSATTGGPYMKFGVPTVANGKVYVPCGDRLAVFGLK